MADATHLMALDIGTARTGVALADGAVRLATPLTTLTAADIVPEVAALVQAHAVSDLVIGLPRNLDGDPTAQTAYVEAQAVRLKAAIDPGVRLHFVDEALTSVKAESELSARGKPYKKADIDMLSAVYILEDYIEGEARQHG